MQVILIHGLGRSPLSLLSLEGALQGAGHVTHQFGYAAFAESYDQIVARLHQQLTTIGKKGAYGIVAHSLGSLLTRSALAQQEYLPDHVVMLGPPNRPPQMAAIAWQFPLFRWFSRSCGFNLSHVEFYDNLPDLSIPYTIIAGTAGPRGRFSPFGMEVNDGIVAVSETRIRASNPVFEFPVWHTFIMNDHRVQQTVLQVLGASR
jgi:pimeloyl-ACP methyl ester carboxylesterase